MRCPRCETNKPDSEFYIRRGRVIPGYCKECSRSYNRAFARKKRDQAGIPARQRGEDLGRTARRLAREKAQRHEAHQTKCITCGSITPVGCRTYCFKCRPEKPAPRAPRLPRGELMERERARDRARNRAGRRRDPEERRRQALLYRSRYPEHVRALKRARRAREAGVPGRCSAKQWQALLNFFGAQCLKCSRWSRGLTMDHIIPISLPGSSHSPINLQPLCSPCNSSKCARYADHRGPYILRGMARLGWEIV